MTKEIRKQLLPMLVVLLLLSSLGVWQLNFVITAVESNVFLNATIFGTFFFGVIIAFRNVFSLDNEVIAFNALREDHEDAVYEESDSISNNDWRSARNKQNAIVFRKPKIIEQPFHIISEEIARTGKLNLSTGVIQNMLDSIDDRIDEKKSLVQYVTGILVFLGLIGTFVGLMVTLGSVGMIIRGIDSSGDGGPAAIQGLMNDLQIPLEGMATGFSSSLFGLITSLALGLMTRFSNQSSNIFRAGFETWLAGLANIGSDSFKEGLNGQNEKLDNQLELMLRVARVSMISNAKLVSSVDNMSNATQQLMESHAHSENTLSQVAKSVSTMIDSHVKSNEILNHVAGTLQQREELRSIMKQLQDDTVKQTNMFSRVNTALSAVIERQIAAHQDLKTKEEEFVLNAQLEDILYGVNDKISKEFSDLSTQVINIDNLITELDNNLGSSVQNTHTQLMNLASHSNDMHQELSHIIEKNKNILIQKIETENDFEGAQVASDTPEDWQVKDYNSEGWQDKVSIIDQQRQLFKHYGAEEQDMAYSQLQKTKKSRFSFFRRSA